MTRERNDGLRKLCECSRRSWAKCEHPWYFNFKWAGAEYQFSLERVVGRLVKTARGSWRRDPASLGDRIDSKTAAEAERDRLRAAIRAGTLHAAPRPQLDTLTLSQLLETYRKDYIAVQRPSTHAADGKPKANLGSQIQVIGRTELERLDGERLAFGRWFVVDITNATIAQFQRVRLASGTTAANRDLALLRHMFRWAIAQDHVERTPFKKGGESVIQQSQEQHRRRRLQVGEGDRLLAACGEHLRAIVEAAIETGCRRGELLSLQWNQVRFEPKAEILLPAQKTKTKRDRSVPMSARLRAILEMRRDDPDGQPLPGDRHVFGNELGEPVQGFKRAWERAVLRAHGHRPSYRVRVVGEGQEARKVRTAALSAESRAALRAIDLHFHDLRREAGSRWLDSGVPLHRIQKWLGHANISQTSTYLMADSADDDEAMRRFEARQAELRRITTDAETGGIQSPQSATVSSDEAPNAATKHH